MRLGTGTSRPLLADVNRDGYVDLVIEGYNSGPLAIDGRNGELLWRAEAPPRNFERRFMFVADDFVIWVGHYELFAYALQSGLRLAKIDLSQELPMLPCAAAPGQLALMNQTGTITAVDLTTRATSLLPATTACTEVRSDRAERKAVDRRRYFPPENVPASVPAIRCGRREISYLGKESEGYVIEDPCLAALGLDRYDDVIPTIEPELALATEAGYVVVGTKRVGHPTPAIALVSERAAKWIVTPDTAIDDGVRQVAVQPGRVAVLYSVESSKSALAIYDLATGALVRSAETENATYLEAVGDKRWMLIGDQFLATVGEMGASDEEIAMGGTQTLHADWQHGLPPPPGYREDSYSQVDWRVGVPCFVVSLISIGMNAGMGYAFRDDGALPLAVPFVGPFVAMGTMDLDGDLFTVLLFDGLGQAIAATGLIAATVGSRQHQLVPIHASVGPGTVMMSGEF
ncbi:MAG: hypothetical protein U0271_08515 [Polyangiaceae bacterium]